MVNMFVSGAVDHRFWPLLGQTKDYVISIFYHNYTLNRQNYKIHIGIIDIINKREEEGRREELKIATKIHNKLRT